MKSFLKIFWFLLTLPAAANAQTTMVPNALGGMNCPMMEHKGTMQKDMSAMMKNMTAMISKVTDPSMKVRMQKMHDQMASMKVHMQMMSGDMGSLKGGNAMQGRKSSSSPILEPLAGSKDHKTHHPSP